jgi:hypothetical protein
MGEFGKKHVPSVRCSCKYNFTCRECLSARRQEDIPAVFQPPASSMKAFRMVFRLKDGRAATWEQFHPDIETAREKMLNAAKAEYPGEVTYHIVAEIRPDGALK